MLKRLVLLAVGVFVLAAPATAGAYINKNGERVKPTSEAKIHVNGVHVGTYEGSWDCAPFDLDEGSVDVNEPNWATVSATGGISPACYRGSGQVPMLDFDVEEMAFAPEDGEGEIYFTYEYDRLPWSQCLYRGELPFSFGEGESAFQTYGVISRVSGFQCPEAASFEGRFSLEAPDGTPLTVDPF